MKLNIGCGEQYLNGFINIDVEKNDLVKPDLIHDMTKGPLPYKDEEVEQIYCIHNIEYIDFKLWPMIFTDFHRVLKKDGFLFLAYPEFEKCANNFITNYKGHREFWRATLYGRQLWPGDFHISPVITSEIQQILARIGFDNFASGPAPDFEYYTNLLCHKGTRCDKEDILKEQLFLNFPKYEGKYHKI